MAWTNSPAFIKLFSALLMAVLVGTTAAAQTLASKPLATPGQTATPPPAGALKDKERQDFPVSPPVTSGPLPAAVAQALAAVAPALRDKRFPSAAVRAIGQGGDARMAWYLNDLMRFVSSRVNAEEVTLAFEQLTRATLPRDSFTSMGDRVLAWNLPAPPGYREMKRDLFLQIEPRWKPFF